MKLKLLQKLNCEYVDEIFTVIGVIFIIGLLFNTGSLNERIHAISTEQAVQIQKMADVAEKRLVTIRKLEETLGVMQTTLTEQNKAIQLLSEYHEQQAIILKDCVKSGGK